jgi:hypothetical protein
LENEQLFFRHIPQRLLVNSEIFRQNLWRQMRYRVAQQDRFGLRKIAVIENEHELASIGIQALNRVRDSRGKKPKIIFAHVGDETFAVQIDGGNPRVSVKHDGSFAGRVPMQLAEATCRQPHVNTSQGLRDGKLPHGHLA